MFEEELDKLMNKEWSEDEKEILDKTIAGLMYFKKIIPKSLKENIMKTLEICNRLKDKLDSCKCE